MGLIPVGHGLMAIVDDGMLEKLMQHKWHVFFHPSGNMYAKTAIKLGNVYKSVYMHRMIASPKEGLVVDHIDGNGLNNCMSNLRCVTRSQNNLNKVSSCNKDNMRGAWWNKSVKKWESSIRCNGVKKHLGYFLTKEEAHKAYVDASISIHGDYSFFLSRK